MPKSVEILLGPLRVDLNEARTLIFRRGARDGLHFTAFHDPGQERNGEKIFTPHFSVGRRRFGWLPFSQTSAREFALTISVKLFQRWLAASKPVDLDALDREGWLVAVADTELMEKWLRKCHVANNTYRAPMDAEWEDFADDMIERLISPADLKTRRPPEAPLTAVRVNEDGTADSTFLSYYPAAWPGGPAGWYVTPMNWMPSRVFLAALLNAAGPRLRAALRMIVGRLGLGDLDQALAGP